MSPNLESNSDFYVLQLAQAVEPASMQKWIAEISNVINSMGGKSIIPTRIGRTEPIFRRQGAMVINEPLDEDMRRGALTRLTEIATKYNISAYIAHDIASAKIAQKLSLKQNAPLIYICHDYFKEQGFFARPSAKINLNKIDHFIVPSRAASDHLMTKFNIDKTRISIVREGIDLTNSVDHAISQERTVSLAQSWGVIEKVVEIVLIPQEFSSLKWQNNLINLLQAWTNKGRDDVHFVIMGDDEGKNAISPLTTRILRQIPSASFQFVGHCADIEAALNLASMLVILDGEPKISHPCALQAQAIGRFVVLPQDAVSGEIFNDISSVIAKSNGEEIAQIIASHIDLSDRARKAIGPAGRAFVSQNHSRDAMHAALRAVFENDKIG